MCWIKHLHQSELIDFYSQSKCIASLLCFFLGCQVQISGKPTSSQCQSQDFYRPSSFWMVLQKTPSSSFLWIWQFINLRGNLIAFKRISKCTLCDNLCSMNKSSQNQTIFNFCSKRAGIPRHICCLHLEFLWNKEPVLIYVYPQNWGKGVVFVNGQNLGRYWFIGPQHFLYLPGPWLRSGDNQVQCSTWNYCSIYLLLSSEEEKEFDFCSL